MRPTLRITLLAGVLLVGLATAGCSQYGSVTITPSQSSPSSPQKTSPTAPDDSPVNVESGRTTEEQP